MMTLIGALLMFIAGALCLRNAHDPAHDSTSRIVAAIMAVAMFIPLLIASLTR